MINKQKVSLYEILEARKNQRKNKGTKNNRGEGKKQNKLLSPNTEALNNIKT